MYFFELQGEGFCKKILNAFIPGESICQLGTFPQICQYLT